MSDARFPALEELLRRREAARLLLEGLNLEFTECAASGRLGDWADAARAIIKVIEGRAPVVFSNDDASKPEGRL